MLDLIVLDACTPHVYLSFGVMFLIMTLEEL